MPTSMLSFVISRVPLARRMLPDESVRSLMEDDYGPKVQRQWDRRETLSQIQYPAQEAGY